MTQTCDQPRRRDRKASRWPSGDQRGSRPRPAWPTTRLSRRAVGLDDPDLVVADEGEAAAVGRPLRVADRLLRRGQLGRIPAAQRDREQLPGARRLGREGDARGRADGAGTRGAARPRRSPRSTGPGDGVVGARAASVAASVAGPRRDAPRADHREVLADVAVQAVVGPGPAVGRAQLARRQPATAPSSSPARRGRSASRTVAPRLPPRTRRPSARSRRRCPPRGRPASSRAARYTSTARTPSSAQSARCATWSRRSQPGVSSGVAQAAGGTRRTSAVELGARSAAPGPRTRHGRRPRIGRRTGRRRSGAARSSSAHGSMTAR